MIVGAVASHTGPGMRFYEHAPVVTTGSPTMPAHPAVTASKIIFGSFDIGVISIDNVTASAISSKGTRYSQIEIGFATSSPAAKAIFDNAVITNSYKVFLRCRSIVH